MGKWPCHDLSLPAARGCGLGLEITFLEQEAPWYAANRDLRDPDYCRLHFYDRLRDLARYEQDIAAADAVMVGSYVPDGSAVGRWVRGVAHGVTLFYDIDTPVTLADVDSGSCRYLTREDIGRYDVYLSFTGGPTLRRLRSEYGARAARAFFCSVDPAKYRPLPVAKRWDLGFLGTYSADRQASLDRLLIEPARRAPHLRFLVVGAQFPATVDWPDNVDRMEHLPPRRHAWFYSSCRWTLNLTRAAMIEAGFSPSVRLFEAAACGTPIISDRWDGIETVLTPGSQVLLAVDAHDVDAALALPDEQEMRIAAAARHRVLREHTARHCALQLVGYIEEALAARLRARASGVQRPRAAGLQEELALRWQS